MGRVSRIAYISGRLGAGKSSLAFPLAAELGYSLVTKDLVKETLHDALCAPVDSEIDQAWSQRLGAASFELLFALAARGWHLHRTLHRGNGLPPVSRVSNPGRPERKAAGASLPCTRCCRDQHR
jgi:hypothetical protein